MKTTVDFGDVMGMSVVLSRVPGAGHIKVLITGLGWAAADLLLTRALPLWVGARGLEFDWKYIQISLDANISLVSCLLLLFFHVNLTVGKKKEIFSFNSVIICYFSSLLPFCADHGY